jgi:hypothetical protein
LYYTEPTHYIENVFVEMFCDFSTFSKSAINKVHFKVDQSLKYLYCPGRKPILRIGTVFCMKRGERALDRETSATKSLLQVNVFR